MREIAPGERRQFQAVLQEAMEENIATRNRQTPRPEVIAHVQARRFRGGNFGSDVSPKRNQELANKGRADETPVIPGCSPCKKSLSQIKFILRRVHMVTHTLPRSRRIRTTHRPRPALLWWLVLLLPPLLSGGCAAGACGQSAGNGGGRAGEDIQIRSLEVLTGIGRTGIPGQRAVTMALAGGSPANAGIDLFCSSLFWCGWRGALFRLLADR